MQSKAAKHGPFFITLGYSKIRFLLLLLVNNVKRRARRTGMGRGRTQPKWAPETKCHLLSSLRRDEAIGIRTALQGSDHSHRIRLREDD